MKGNHISVMIIVFCALSFQSAAAFEKNRPEIKPGGDIKGFFHTVFPYDFPLLPDYPYGENVLDFRFKLEMRHGSLLRMDIHNQLTVTSVSGDSQLNPGLISISEGVQAPPEAIKLSWSPEGDPSHVIQSRIDRLSIMLRLPRFNLIAGRQPVSFGRSVFFTPLDLVSPFSPMIVDKTYKPGIDALRGDAFFGVAGQITALAAYAGSLDMDGMIYAGRAGTTFRGWDFAAFGGIFRNDIVLGLESSGSVGATGLRAEGSWTMPGENEDDFVRITAGADQILLAGRLILTEEIHYSSTGVDDPSEIPAYMLGQRFQRGEIWTTGKWYAAASATYVLSPIFHISGFGIINLMDASLLLGPSIEWSVSDNARLIAGVHFGIGEKPQFNQPFNIVTATEFGIYPAVANLSIQCFF